MGTDHKEELIRVLQILEETDEKSKNRPAGAWNRRRRSV